MDKFRLNINGKEVTGIPGQTILEVARENDIFIPTLCYDERTRIYGSCGICMCEVEGNPKLCKACATVIAPGMVVKTNTERVIESRKTNLELLLSNHTGDCRPPCVLACPAQTDCQGYVGLIANGEFEEALKLITQYLDSSASKAVTVKVNQKIANWQCASSASTTYVGTSIGSQGKISVKAKTSGNYTVKISKSGTVTVD